MRALVTLMAALSLPIGILNMVGGLTAGIWLAFLGEWKAIGIGLLLLVSSHFLLAFVLMPRLIFTAAAVKEIESGKTALGGLIGSLSVLYTAVVVVVWAYMMLGYFYGRASGSTEIPLLLWSYGAATGPWVFMASKDQQGPDGGNPHSVFFVFFLSLGYICCMLVLLLGSVSLSSCLWILGGFMAASCIVSESMNSPSKCVGAAKTDSAHAAVGMKREPDIDDPMERLEDRIRVASFLGAAEEGDPKAQAIVAVFFADAKGAPRDDIEAYKWCHLAAKHGVKKAELIRDFLVGRMTRDQICEAEKRAAAFVPQRQET